ncbi:hypothetical protein [Pseudoalteromonas sp. GB56]
MNYKTTALCLSTLLAISSFTSSAASADSVECAMADDKPTTRKQYVQCLDKKLELGKRELETWKNKRRFDLEGLAKSSGITQPLDIYLRSEKSFINYLEDSCRWRYLRMMPDAVAAAIAYKQCELRLIDQRITTYKAPLD